MNRPAHRRSATYLSILVCLAAFWLVACEQLQPPVSVGQRDSAVGQGKVILITNTSDAPLQEVRVRVEGADGEAREHFEASLGAKEALQVGWLKLDGWPIPEGAKVSVTADGYAMAFKATL